MERATETRMVAVHKIVFPEDAEPTADLAELVRNEIRQTGASMNRSAARPSNVVRFEQLMYVQIGIGVIQLPLGWKGTVAQFGAGFVVFFSIFSFAGTILLIWLTARRRNAVARGLLLMFFIVGFSSVLENGPLPHFGLVSGTLTLLQLALRTLALFFIFTGNSREWFPKTPRARLFGRRGMFRRKE